MRVMSHCGRVRAGWA